MMKKCLLPIILLFSILEFSGCINNQYTVSFDSNGGSSVDRIKVKEGNLVNKPEDPTRKDSDKDYDFVNWYRDQTLMIIFNFETDIISSDIVLYAKWEVAKPVYTVTFDLNGGIGTTPPPQQVKLGQIVQDPKIIPTKSEYIFAGWSLKGASDLFQLNTRTVSENTTLYALWIEDNIQNQLLAAMNKIKNQEFIKAHGQQVLEKTPIDEQVWIDYKNKKYLSKTYGLNNTILGRCIYLENNEKYSYNLLPAITRIVQSDAFEEVVYNLFYTPYLQAMANYLGYGGVWKKNDHQYEATQSLPNNAIKKYWAKLNNGLVEEVGFRTTQDGNGTDSAKITFKYNAEAFSYPQEDLGDKTIFKRDTTKKVTIIWSDNYNNSVLYRLKSSSTINVSDNNISHLRKIFSGEECYSTNGCWKAAADKEGTPLENNNGTYTIQGSEVEIYANKRTN